MPKNKTTTKEVDYKNVFLPRAGQEEVFIPSKVLEITKNGVHRSIKTLTDTGNLRKVNKKYIVHLIPTDDFVSKTTISGLTKKLNNEFLKKQLKRKAGKIETLSNNVPVLNRRKFKVLKK